MRRFAIAISPFLQVSVLSPYMNRVLSALSHSIWVSVFWPFPPRSICSTQKSLLAPRVVIMALPSPMLPFFVFCSAFGLGAGEAALAFTAGPGLNCTLDSVERAEVADCDCDCDCDRVCANTLRAKRTRSAIVRLSPEREMYFIYKPPEVLR